MPVTRGAGNPDWTRDETILALDLFYRRGALDRGSPEVMQLSELLRNAHFYPLAERKDNFRNPDGVALKLQNLRSAIDPSRGLSSSKRDRQIVTEFPSSRAGVLADLANMIRNSIRVHPSEAVAATTEDLEEVFAEGELITAVHRKRDRRLRTKLLASRSGDELVCEICGFRPPRLGRSLQESFFEAHHVRPLADQLGKTETRLADLALLCANCHRFLHRIIVLERRWIGPAEARKTLTEVMGPAGAFVEVHPH